MDHNKRTKVKGFCNFHVLFTCCSDLAQETSHAPSPSATFLSQQHTSCCHVRPQAPGLPLFLCLTQTIPAAGWWTAELQPQEESQLQSLSQQCKQEGSRAQPWLAEEGTEGKVHKNSRRWGEEFAVSLACPSCEVGAGPSQTDRHLWAPVLPDPNVWSNAREDCLSLLSSLLTSSVSCPPRWPLSQALYMGSSSIVPALDLVPSLQLSRSDGILPSEKSESLIFSSKTLELASDQEAPDAGLVWRTRGKKTLTTATWGHLGGFSWRGLQERTRPPGEDRSQSEIPWGGGIMRTPARPAPAALSPSDPTVPAPSGRN
ncbi:transmembrane protein 234 isoform X1 [Monodon monoceros]|uniref:transmembrane protein 234 isoform X1 n=1 Tax=Monodon monoceros TaxID=40151 RepID=UPI0010F4A90A|nr:transmembrane protein 234 isoform X1 [Monodon monoceros]